MPQPAQFAIVWQAYQGASPTGRPLASPVAFPFLMDGASHAALTEGRPARLDARGLLLGLLIAYDDPTPVQPAASQAQMSETLADAGRLLGTPSLEVALLDGSGYLRERHGLGIGRVALTTATAVLPSSAMIRSDLIVTCWDLLSEVPDAVRPDLLTQIAGAYREQDLPLIDPNAAERVVFARFVAASVLPGQQKVREALARSEALRRIRHPWYVPRMQYLFTETTPELARVL